MPTRIKYYSLLVILLRLKMWDFLIMWWSRVTRFFAFPLSFKIVSLHSFDKASYFLVIFKIKFYFSSQGFIFPLLLNYWPIKFKFLLGKKRKMHRLTVNLNIRVKPNKPNGWKSWFCIIVIYPFYENILTKRLYQDYYETWSLT